MEQKSSRKILEGLAQLGIGKLDIAPSYGEGNAEEIVGDFCTTHGHQFSICTKVGIPRETPKYISSGLKALVRPLFRKIQPALTTFPLKPRPANCRSTGNFELQYLRRSLEESLALLRVDFVSRLLLHEPSEAVRKTGAIDWLNSLVKIGTIREFGTGTGETFSTAINAGTIQQARFCIGFDTKANQSTIQVAHGILRSTDQSGSKTFERTKISRIVDIDKSFLNDDCVLSAIKLCTVGALYSDAEIIFSTTSPQRLHSTVTSIKKLWPTFTLIKRADLLTVEAALLT